MSEHETIALNVCIYTMRFRISICEPADLVREGVALEEKRKPCVDL